MYKKKHNGWIEYTDFILLELLSLNISFLFAYCLHHGWLILPYEIHEYLLLIGILSLLDVISVGLFGSFDKVLSRSLIREFGMSIRHVAILFAELTLYLFAVQKSAFYSRVSLLLTFIFDLILGCAFRLLYRKSALARKKRIRTFLVVTELDRVMEVLEGLKADSNIGIKVTGIALTDKDYTGCSFYDIPVVASVGGITEYIRKSWIDEVFLVLPEKSEVRSELIKNLTEMGVSLHVNIEKINDVPEKNQIYERIGNYSVITSSIMYTSAAKLLVKRIGDILIGLIGCLFTILLSVVLAPIILIKSPGHLFFVQERVGQNGKHFKIIKFRSMITNAESQKNELMSQNTMSDDKMFKMDWDPRVIGNKILSDGRKKTGIGEFIRKTSIDEFPQFFNVLKGDMSLVGTRPPTVDEWEKYELHHRARLATKPGITGLWQVSGRSDITDFEDVVKLDTEYIYNWSIGMDIKILFKTIGVVFKGQGAK